MSPLHKQAIRKLTRRLRMKISGGPARGLWWSLPTRSRFLRGTYEDGMAQFFHDNLKPDDVFWDVGAHFGYYTLIASRTLTAGLVVSFEPSSENRWYLGKHVEWNDLQNVTIQDNAVGKMDDTCSFGGDGTGSGFIGGAGEVTVVRSVDSLLADGDQTVPTILKVDVEGEEANVLKGAQDLITAHHPTMIIATHGVGVHRECVALTEGFGYEVYESKAASLILAVAAENNRGREWANPLFA